MRIEPSTSSSTAPTSPATSDASVGIGARGAPVVIVTGAAGGIGRAVVRALAARGATVVACGGRSGPPVDPGVDLAPAPGVPALGAIIPDVVDVTRESSVDELFARVVAHLGRVDVLINNAGVFGPGDALPDLAISAWRHTVDVNLTGAMICTRAAMRVMRAQQPRGGRIVNNGSISAQVPRPHSAAYAASKAGLAALTTATSLDGRADGIAAGQIDIGNAATSMLDVVGVGTGSLQPDGSRRTEPVFAAEDAARAIAFMALLPPEATVDRLTITATGMPFAGRG